MRIAIQVVQYNSPRDNIYAAICSCGNKWYVPRSDIKWYRVKGRPRWYPCYCSHCRPAIYFFDAHKVKL